MNKSLIWLVGMLLVASSVFTACKDDVPTYDPNSEWARRNDAFLDSIVRVCENPPAGETWEKILSYKLQNDGDIGGIEINKWGKNDYVYVKYLRYWEDKEEAEQPKKGITPGYSDTVAVHYRGMYYDGRVFDQSFTGDWNGNVHETTKFAVSGVVSGWTTALMEMEEYTHAMLYIPYTLGYKESGYQDIPGYSTLVFDLRLEKIIHPKGPDDRKLKKKQMEQ